MHKRKKSSSKKQSKTLVYIAWILTFIAVALSSVVAGYYFGYDDAKKETVKKEQIKEEKRSSVLKKLEDSGAKKEDLDVNNRLKEVLKKESKTIAEDKEAKEEKEVKAKDENQTKIEKEKAREKEAVKEYEDASHEVEGAVLPAPPKREIVKISTKAKLAIIIDDVSVKSHVSAVENLKLPITMSFLPPSELRPNSHVLASKEKFYMVHLPMEAKNFKREEPFTLRVEDSQEKISQRIIEIKKLFPRVKYINNHAGSKFTSDEGAVGRLIHVLNEQNISFIDSRTIGESKVPSVMKSYKKQYVGRDVFLDHQIDKDYIKSQIKKAIEVAKLHGSAIAIGHPHANTILAIDESKHLFKDVELVLVDKLY
ncbi:MAG: divergent polysaccharide deacetylase family protein [Sulfurimonas sp.]|uniref:divergent polysaccharide deacetylase family protein n=1 Tax=Sulfurimonas sp. TaxID=2022749 RepID=UPI00261B23E0|nr:divergent polysaccharide deacetylase family protein [Sulfurimonas sp.]MDD5399852.1 divergent polysaccharide deacetylase family protein [Sulfurimonas sp.]